MEKDYRMYILVNKDVKIGKGKLAGQVGHAVAVYYWQAMSGSRITKEEQDERKELLDIYMNTTQKKIILFATQDKLEELEAEGYIAIRDKGLTQLEPNTLTCVNVGLYEAHDVPDWIKKLKLVN